MTPAASDDDATIRLEGPFTASALRGLRSHGPIDCLSLTKQPVITAALAKALTELVSVRWLHLWCATTRTAMGHVIKIPGLEELDVLGIRHPGALENFADATELKRFYCCFLSEADLLGISRVPNLERLGVQESTLSRRALDAILSLPKLRELDLEASNLDDEMATALASCSTIETLAVGSTGLTAKGLRGICAMSQLRSLDLWSLRIQDQDLELLKALPNLEYLSIGDPDHSPRLTAEGVIPRLAALPSLKRVWLDGITLSAKQRAALEKRFDEVRN